MSSVTSGRAPSDSPAMTPQAISLERSPGGAVVGWSSTNRNATTNSMANMSVRARPDCSQKSGDSAMATAATRATAQSTKPRSSTKTIAATAAPESDDTSVSAAAWPATTK